MVPHITDALQDWIVDVSKKPVDQSDQEVFVFRYLGCSVCFHYIIRKCQCDGLTTLGSMEVLVFFIFELRANH